MRISHKPITSLLKTSRPTIPTRNFSKQKQTIHYTKDQVHHFGLNEPSLPIYKQNNTHQTTKGDSVKKLKTDQLIYCVSAFFTLKSTEDPSHILAAQAIHINSRLSTNIIDLKALEEPLKRQHIPFSRHCITYSSYPGLTDLETLQNKTLNAISELCHEHGYTQSTSRTPNDSVSLNLEDSTLELSQSNTSKELKQFEIAHLITIILLPVVADKMITTLTDVMSS